MRLPALLAATALCLLGSLRAAAAWHSPGVPLNKAGESEFIIRDDYAIATNIWHHVLRYYAVVEAAHFEEKQYDSPFADILFSQNVAICKLPVTKAAPFYANILGGWVGGTTLWVDFPFPAFPENMGHWVEELLPIYSQLTEGSWQKDAPSDGRFLQTVLFTNMRRTQVEGMPWAVEMLKLALAPGLAPGAPAPLPHLIFFDELESQNSTLWVGFQRVLHVRDRYKHPNSRSGFYTPAMAAAFRAAAYAAAGAPRPPSWGEGGPPRTITYLMSPGGEQVVNNADVLAALNEVGARLGMAVRPYSVTPGAPFASFVAAMVKTGLLVARHGPLLSNAVFLPPGAVVLELLPYNWEWQGISEIYVNMTRSMGDVHHFAWKADSATWVAYASDDDAKYSHWSADECVSRYCLEAHARAGMLVDTAAVKRALEELLPPALRGTRVQELARRRPWPPRPKQSGGTGLWWEIEGDE